LKSPKTHQALGFAFLAIGIAFLAVGIATHMTAFWAIGPAFTALGVVFLVVSKSGKNFHKGPDSVGREA
jgi:hypothetical protein